MRVPSSEEQDGFTLVELLVAAGLLSVITIGFFSVMLSGVRGADVTEAGVDVSAEARLGLNRMIRDVREAQSLELPITGSEFTIGVDFNRDGDVTDAGEEETFAFDEDSDAITLSVGTTTEVLVDGVAEVPGEEVFQYTSNFLEFDQNDDGIVTCAEVDTPPTGKSGGDRSGGCNEAELPFLTSVDFTFSVTSGSEESERSEEFFAQAQLRNLR